MSFFDEIKINGESFSIKQNIISKILFTELETMLGNKVCSYELVRKEKEGIKGIKTFGTFQVYFGNNIASALLKVLELLLN